MSDKEWIAEWVSVLRRLIWVYTVCSGLYVRIIVQWYAWKNHRPKEVSSIKRTWYFIIGENIVKFDFSSLLKRMSWAHPGNFENRIPLKPAQGGDGGGVGWWRVCTLANYRVAYEKTQSNRVSDFHDFMCSLFPKVILFDFYFSKKNNLLPFLLK